VKLSVDAAQCTGHGRRYLMAPDLLECDDEGYVTIRGGQIDVRAGGSARGSRRSCGDVP
jgi:ferredoxin